MKRGVKLLVFLSAGLLLQPAFIPTASGDNCYSDCIIRYGCFTSNPYAGSDCYELCRSSCRPDGWGAIAYSSKDKVFGWSFALDYKGTAEQVAKQYCAKRGGANCIIQASYYEACGAVAADGALVAWGTEKHKSEGRAKSHGGMRKNRRQELRRRSVGLLGPKLEFGLAAREPAPAAESHIVGRHRLQHSGYGRRVVTGQGGPGQRGKRSHERMFPARQGVRFADRFQQTVRGTGSGS